MPECTETPVAVLKPPDRDLAIAVDMPPGAAKPPSVSELPRTSAPPDPEVTCPVVPDCEGSKAGPGNSGRWLIPRTGPCIPLWAGAALGCEGTDAAATDTGIGAADLTRAITLLLDSFWAMAWCSGTAVRGLGLRGGPGEARASAEPRLGPATLPLAAGLDLPEASPPCSMAAAALDAACSVGVPLGKNSAIF